jgi:hypothetical protein
MRCRSVDGAAPQWAGQARKEIESLSRGKAQPFHTSGGTAANTLNTYQKTDNQVSDSGSKPAKG